MSLEIRYSRQASKDLAGLPVADRRRAIRRLEAYSEAPNAPHHDVVRLVGTDEYRLRVGD